MKPMSSRDKIRIAKWKPIKSASKKAKVDLWFPTAGIGYRPNCSWSTVLQCWSWIEERGYVTTMPNSKPSHWAKPLNLRGGQ